MVLVFAAFVFLAGFTAGGMATLQLQHYSLYPLVGAEQFKAYIAANNRAARLPSVLPAMLLLVSTALLTALPPPFLPRWIAAASLALSLVSLASTFTWQRPLQGEMALDGYSQRQTDLLLRTNWIRTVAHLLEAALATGAVVHALAL